MSFAVRDGKFDVVIAAGPRIETWPSVGVRALSILCAEMGLSVGQFGGESLTVRGVIPLPSTGGLVLLEDLQKRIHRIHARAIVRVSAESHLPNPFPGWQSQGLIPISTAEKLHQESEISWDPVTTILGTGNRALRFASILLQSGVSQVYCVELNAQWKAKRFAGWEVEKRNFEMLGGRMIEAKPLQLLPLGALHWQLRLQDAQGIRVLDVARVVSAGPFQDSTGVREHPPGSFLFELAQTARANRSQDVEGWALEEERGKWLGGKIVKALINELGQKKEALERTVRRAKLRLKRSFKHRESPFTPSYQGKWMSISDAKWIKKFGGLPQHEHLTRPIAAIECFEDIPCNICQTVCPSFAIQMGRVPRSKNSILNEAACTACGLCLTACPTRSISMVRENENRSTSELTLPWKGTKPWTVGEFAVLVNRRGENLGSARVTAIPQLPEFPVSSLTPLHKEEKVQLIQLEVPTHLLWDARGLKKGRTPATYDEAYLAVLRQSALSEEKIEITLNGEKRRVRDRVPISIALFEMGQSRPLDILFCQDGSCGLCDILVDGIRKSACQTRIHRGMSIRVPNSSSLGEPHSLCPCLGITEEKIVERIKQGKLRSPEAVLSVTHVGEGKCHGQLCMSAFRRVLLDQGLPVSHWIDWRFPWSDWLLNPN